MKTNARVQIIENKVTAIISNCIDMEYSANDNLIKDNIVSDGYHGIYSLYCENNVCINNILTKTKDSRKKRSY